MVHRRGACARVMDAGGLDNEFVGSLHGSLLKRRATESSSKSSLKRCALGARRRAGDGEVKDERGEVDG